MLYVVAACEIAFWVVLSSGLLLRYAARLRRTGTAVLAAVPAVDLVLLAATAVRLGSGAPVAGTDGLAAVYLGTSLAFGPSLLRWADVRFAHWFGGAPKPERPPRGGRERARRERRAWYRHAAAFAVGAVLLLAGAALAGFDRAAPLLGWIRGWAVILSVDFLWSFSYTVFPARPGRPPARPRGHREDAGRAAAASAPPGSSTSPGGRPG